MREFQALDLLWIEPIAKAQDCYKDILEALSFGNMAYVQENEALVVLWQDIHGTVIGGLTNLPHIKSATKIGRFLVDHCRANNIPVHTHDTKGTYGRKLAERWGFREDGDAMWLNEVKRRAI